MMKFFIVAIQIEETGILSRCDAIEHDEKVWLVTKWIEVVSLSSG